jgi:hypothetical protein
MMQTMTREEIVQQLVERWPSPLVARCESGRFSGGVVSPRYLANLDSAGKGPTIRVQFGGKVAYPTRVLAEWLAGRVKAH